jgi:hypothetical protein
VWTAWDTSSPALEPSLHPDSPEWTHANSLDYDEATNTYWIGFRNLDCLAQIDRTTGEILQRVGGTLATTTFVDPAEGFLGQHQFQWLDDGLLVFDNRGGPSELSRAVEYGWAGEALQQRWEWVSAYWVYALGDVARDDHGTRVTLTTAGEVDQLDTEGNVVARMNTDVGTAFGYSDRIALPEF